MKNLLLKGVSLAMLTTAGLYAHARYAQSKELKEAPTLDKQVLYILQSNGCLDCHSATPRVPFYGSFPVVGEMVNKDITNAYRYLNLDNLVADLETGAKPSQVDIAKLEQSTQTQSMPPAQYKMAHWVSALSDQERETILTWVSENRLKYYSNNLTATEHRNEPISAMQEFSINPMVVALGSQLYHDVRLSKDNTISCATCHPLDNAGVDHIQFSEGIYKQIGGINAPTVYNAAYNVAQFWDGRKADLAAQAGGPPFDALEMGSESWEEIIGKLEQDPALVAQFKALENIYPEGMTGDNIMDAIAQFEMTLTTPNSRFDLYLKGDQNAITAEEKEGYDLFKEYNCATCHVGQSLGGQSFEYMGIVKDYFANREMKADREIIQIKDQGHFNATQNEADRGYFKTPNLTNVAITPPYLHDGTAETLEEALDVMLEYQVGREATPEEKAKIVGFMKTLTGQYQGKTLTQKSK